VKRIARTAAVLTLLLFGLSGCAHHVGYTDLRVTDVPLAGPRRTGDRGRFLRVLHHPTPDEPTLRVQVCEKVTVEEPVLRRFSGCAVVVPYRWTTPFLKVLVPVTLAAGVVMSFRQPHDHAADLWGPVDYLRDVFAWVNPFEAFPAGPQRIRAGRVTFRSERAWAPARVTFVPLRRVGVRLTREGRILARARTDARGACSFALRPLARRMRSSRPFALTIVSGEARRRIILGAQTQPPLQGF